MANEQLTAAVKNICRITWTDEVTEARVSQIMEDAAVHLHHQLGMPDEPTQDAFADAGTERMLFLNYCLYSWNNMEESFAENYRRDILTARHKYEVEAERNAEEDTDV